MNNIEEGFTTPGLEDLGQLSPSTPIIDMGTYVPSGILTATSLEQKRLEHIQSKKLEVPEKELYDGTGASNLPGTFGVAAVLPYLLALKEWFSFTKDEVKRKDYQTVSELVLTLPQLVGYLYYATINIWKYATEFITFFFIPISITASMINSLSLTGSLLCALEFLIQGRWIYRTVKFHKQFTHDKDFVLQDLKTIRDNYLSLSEDELAKIEKKGLGSPERIKELKDDLLTEKVRQLSRVVRPRLAKQICDDLPILINYAKSGSKAEKAEAHELMLKVKKQCEKRLLIGAISLVGVLFSFTYMVLLPFTSVLSISLAATAISLVGTACWAIKYFLFQTTINEDGWSCKPSKIIPEVGYKIGRKAIQFFGSPYLKYKGIDSSIFFEYSKETLKTSA
ncbi:MAG: hypothetical protein SNF33_07590 [Candidatus Algichlamydia australiensis]|nr:hypothetical protein [Chlamydiales bacterium]